MTSTPTEQEEMPVKNLSVASLTCFLLSLLAAPGMGAVIHIPNDYIYIQEGIDVAQDGDIVLVAPGDYDEALVLEGKQITLTSESGPENTVIRRLYAANTDAPGPTVEYRGGPHRLDRGGDL